MADKEEDMNFFEPFDSLDSLATDLSFVLWWIVSAKLFKLDLNWLKTIPYKWILIGYIGLFFIRMSVGAIEAK